MKRIYLNLKRFDIPLEWGGVNRLAPAAEWGAFVVESILDELGRQGDSGTEIIAFLPEAQIPGAVSRLSPSSRVRAGCQSVHYGDVSPGGNFGAFTSDRPASAMAALGCEAAMVGHSEERRSIAGILTEASAADDAVVNRILNKKARCATGAGMDVLYCIGETLEQQGCWQEVLSHQLSEGLDGVDPRKITIAYEPIWAIGPGKTPPDRAYIEKIARFAVSQSHGLPVVYGGGLKEDNAGMLATIPEISGGLVALTRFSGEIGFYPDEFVRIIRAYMGGN
jgi:triosephosphate isomerase (TIM)